MAKKGPRDLSEKSVPQLKATLDEVFGKWVKRNWSADGFSAECYTCGKWLQLGTRNCQWGHFISRSYSTVRYDENNSRIQCSYCNEFRAGRSVEFEKNLRLEVGDDVIDELKERALQKHKWYKPDLIDMIIYYREQLKNLS